MYGKLWSFVNHHIDSGYALAVYLPTLIIGWALAGCLIGAVACSVIPMDFTQKLADVICAGGYAGVFLGFFGGVLYLYRR